MKNEESKEKIVIASTYVILGIIVALLFGMTFNLPIAFSIAIGGSMFPTIKMGDLIILLSTKIIKPKIGGIYVYKSGFTFIIHRIIKINNSMATFKGDNNVVPDSPVPVSHVLYKAVLIIPYYIWVPILAILLVGVGLLPQYYLYKHRKNSSYSIHSLMIFLIFMIIISVFSSSLFIDTGYTVKPNPMVKINNITSTGNKYYIKFNIPPKSVSCVGGYCNLSGNTLTVKPSGGAMWFYVKPPTTYNLTEEFTVNFFSNGRSK